MNIPYLPNNAILTKPGDDLQAAFTESGLTGKPVFLGPYIYIIKEPLKLNGATVIGCLSNQMTNWNIGGTVLHFQFQNKGDCLTLNMCDNYKSPVLCNVGLVFYHTNSPLDIGVAFSSDCVGGIIDNVIIDRPGRGLAFHPSPPGLIKSIGHRINNLRIQSFRTCGIFAPKPLNTSDHYFTGLTYLQGQPKGDYVTNPVIPTTYPIGIDSLGNSWVFDNLLIEDCSIGIRTNQLINCRIKDLFIDNCRGVGIEFGQPFVSKERLYDGTLYVGIFKAQSAVPKARLTVGINQLSYGLFKYSISNPKASWIFGVPPIKI